VIDPGLVLRQLAGLSPFVFSSPNRNGLDYSKLAVVVDSEALQTPEGVEAITMELMTRCR